METLVTQLPQYGLLGLLLAISMAVAAILARELRGCWRERLSDAQRLSEVVQANHVIMMKTNDLSEARTRAQETATRAQEMAAITLVSNTEEIKRLQAACENLRHDVVRLRDMGLGRRGDS